MSFDYDLVIVGGDWVGRSAAAKAGRLQARVALVEPESAFQPIEIQSHLLGMGGPVLRSMQNLQSDGVTRAASQWQTLLETRSTLTAALASNEDVGYSHTQLAALGVDVIQGQGQFERESTPISRSPRSFAFLVNDRILRSRNYLLATGSIPILPPIPGLESVNYRTIDSFWQNPWQTLPTKLVIVGTDPRGIILAQMLNRLGVHVTLVTRNVQLLPNADRRAVFLLQALLEAEGIDVLTQTDIRQVKPNSTQLSLQLATQDLEAEALLLATDRYPNITVLNLEAIGVQHHARGISVNTRLQTTHPHIYACGEVLGGYALPNVAAYEAEVALHNAFFSPKKQINYNPIPWAVLTDPPFVQVGLTEQQARNAYNDVQVLQQGYKSLVNAHVQGEPIGFCQVIVRSGGEILGVQGVGVNAQEWINVMALAIERQINLNAINSSAFVSPSFSEVISQIIQQWKGDQLPPRGNWRDWLDFR